MTSNSQSVRLPILRGKTSHQLFGVMVTTLNMDHKKLRRELSQEIREKVIDKRVRGKGLKTISKQDDLPVTTQQHISFRSLGSMGL